jgi:hypothetical protein
LKYSELLVRKLISKGGLMFLTALMVFELELEVSSLLKSAALKSILVLGEPA